MRETVLEVTNLVKHYPLRQSPLGARAVLHALDGASLSLARGETLALVGESGCNWRVDARQ